MTENTYSAYIQYTCTVEIGRNGYVGSLHWSKKLDSMADVIKYLKEQSEELKITNYHWFPYDKKIGIGSFENPFTNAVKFYDFLEKQEISKKKIYCIKEIKKHISRVRYFISTIEAALIERKKRHDKSKFSPEELDIFVEFTPKLKGSTYGSEKYKGFLEGLKPALDHHYAMNRHHPEHHEKGIGGMNLIDLMEALADWKSATERHDDGDIRKSLLINQKRFGYSDELYQILLNTVNYLKW